MISDVMFDGKSSKFTALMPTHNSLSLLEHNIRIMKNASIDNMLNLVIIDDRSTEDVKQFCIENKIGYIRIEHDYGFNYSLNINEAIRSVSGHTDNVLVINNDCYLHDSRFLSEFISRHKLMNSSLSAIKLLYPPESLSFKGHEDDKVDRVQFGDGIFLDGNMLSPSHFGIMQDKDHASVNSDRKTLGWVTGACNLIRVEDFIECGGYNTVLSGAFQDVLFSLCLSKRYKDVYYFGSNIYFYHDESTTRMDDWNKNANILWANYKQELSRVCQIY